MGAFNDIIEETAALLKSHSALSSCRILKAHPDSFHQAPLSKVTVTVSFGGAQVENAAMGDFLGVRSTGDLYGKRGDVTLDLTVWSPLATGGEAAWETASALCDALLFSDLGFTKIQCGEISYDSSALALILPCRANKRLAFGRISGGETVSGVVVKGNLTQGKGVE